MKRMFVLAFLPVMLFALETVNLIKDHSFEKDSELWQTYTGRSDGKPDSAIANRHDAEKAFQGSFSGSCDNRRGDNLGIYYDTAIVIQGFCCRKTVSDLDSLTLNYAVTPRLPDREQAGWIALYIDAGENPYWIAGYFIVREGTTPVALSPNKMLDFFYFSPDTMWHLFTRNVNKDITSHGIAPTSTVDSFLVLGAGAYNPPRYGQKIYWDDVRLMGYADYDVGVKEILSGDSVREDTPYTPEARIKNFGREDAPEFSVIAEIWDAETRVYYDSLPWSLTSDTEDTVTFAAFTPTSAANHTLVVRTSMSPDESDEDDVMTKTLYGTGISEQLGPQTITLDVRSLASPLRVSYSLPYTEPGTLTLYDAAGRRIERIIIRGSGETDFTCALPSGVYLVRLKVNQATVTRKAVVIR